MTSQEVREAIRAGAHGKRLAAKLEAGQLDAPLARRLIREDEAERAERARHGGASRVSGAGTGDGSSGVAGANLAALASGVLRGMP
jgi:hypothetical protein